MGNISVRNVDDEVLGRLRKRAASHGLSLEEEVRRILARAARIDRDVFLEWVERHRFPIPAGCDVVEIIRSDRDAR